jgi:hypothetical protein
LLGTWWAQRLGVILGVALLGGALLLALWQVARGTGRGRSTWAAPLAALLFFATMAFYLWAAAAESRLARDADTSPAVPVGRLSDGALNAVREDRRLLFARWAYQWYGVVLSYRDASVATRTFEPTSKDREARDQWLHDQADARRVRETLWWQASDLAWAGGAYAAGMGIMLLWISVWAALVPRSRPRPADSRFDTD